jgi:hypothetical protein
LRYPRTKTAPNQGGQNDRKLETGIQRNCRRGSGERPPLIRLTKILLVAALAVGFGFAAPASANAPLVAKGFVHRTPEAAQNYAKKLVKLENWDNSQWQCLKSLWTAESNWRPDAYNKTPVYQVHDGKRVKLHAGGIPQILNLNPKTPVKTQVQKGLRYIKSRYGNPCSAWRHHLQRNWY